jgi:hypothetical protein
LDEFLVISGGVLGSSLDNSFGVLSDIGVDFGEQGLDGFDLGGGQSFFDLRELSLEIFGGLFLELGHVVIDMDSEDSFSVHGGVISITRIGVLGESGESLLVVGDVKSTIGGSFHGSENSLSDSGVDNSDVEEGLEGSLLLDIIVNGE